MGTCAGTALEATQAAFPEWDVVRVSDPQVLKLQGGGDGGPGAVGARAGGAGGCAAGDAAARRASRVSHR